MKNPKIKNFAENIKYMFFAHGGSALFYVLLFSSSELQYTDTGKLATLNALFLRITMITFAVSAFIILSTHFANSEKKMKFLNETYNNSDNIKKAAFLTGLYESASVALANFVFQIPMIIIFSFVGYRYGTATIFETLYICDVGVYIAFGNAFLGALLISLAWFAVYFLGVSLFVSPIWNMGRIRKKDAPVTPEAPAQDAYFRYIFQNKYKIFHVLKKLVLSVLFSFLAVTVASLFIIALTEGWEKASVMLLYGVIYILVFYMVHSYRLEGSYYPHEKKFSFTKEAEAFFKGEMVYYLFLFAVLALTCEISLFIAPIGTNNVVISVCSFVFPLYYSISLPIVRSLINIIWASAVVLFCAVGKSYLSHRKVSRASKYRR